MPKPSEVSSDVPECPICNLPGEAVWYKHSDPYLASKYMMECVVNHAINDQTKGKQKDEKRNDMCWLGESRQAEEDERDYTWHANPKTAPDWWDILRRWKKRNGGTQTKL